MLLSSSVDSAALEAVNSVIFGSHGVWFLIGAALVFFMQAGFAMVEAGFTRAKNAGNIIMKNTLDFCLGTVAFFLLGYNFLCGHAVLPPSSYRYSLSSRMTLSNLFANTLLIFAKPP